MCQLCASRTMSGVEKGLLSPTCTHSSLAFHNPSSGPAKSGRQILLKPSLLLIHACGLLLHTHTYLSGIQGVIFPSLSLVLHTQMHRRPERLHGFLYVSLRLTHRTKQVIRAWVKSSIHIVLSVCSQSASLFHSGRTPLTAGRI